MAEVTKPPIPQKSQEDLKQDSKSSPDHDTEKSLESPDKKFSIDQIKELWKLTDLQENNPEGGNKQHPYMSLSPLMYSDEYMKRVEILINRNKWW